MTVNKGRVLVVSNRLPVTLACKEKKWEAKSSSGGLVNALNPVLKNRGGFWIGWAMPTIRCPRTRGRYRQKKCASPAY